MEYPVVSVPLFGGASVSVHPVPTGVDLTYSPPKDYDDIHAFKIRLSNDQAHRLGALLMFV